MALWTAKKHSYTERMQSCRIFRVHFQDADSKFSPDKKTLRANLEQCEKENPEKFEQWFWETFMHFNPKYSGELLWRT